MKIQVPPFAFFLRAEWLVGWEKTEIRPEQELVVKKEGCELMALRRGIMGKSNVPLGELSGSEEFIATMAAAFLLSNSIVWPCYGNLFA